MDLSSAAHAPGIIGGSPKYLWRRFSVRTSGLQQGEWSVASERLSESRFAGFMRGLCSIWEVLMRPSGAVWLLLGTLLWLGMFGWVRSLHIPDEGRYVGVAWDMIRFHSTWTPLLNGLPYFHKPPLFYWLNEASFLVFGVHEWAARVPSLLASWLTVVALYFFVRRHRGVQVATLSVLALVTMPYYYGASQYANLDMLVAGMISLTLLAGAEAVSRAAMVSAGRLVRRCCGFSGGPRCLVQGADWRGFAGWRAVFLDTGHPSLGGVQGVACAWCLARISVDHGAVVCVDGNSLPGFSALFFCIPAL